MTPPHTPPSHALTGPQARHGEPTRGAATVVHVQGAPHLDSVRFGRRQVCPVSDEGLSRAPEPEPEPINVGDRVTLRTIWGGDQKPGGSLGHDSDGWPTVTVPALREYRQPTVDRPSVLGDERPTS